jgi:hypothetical protein
MATTRVCVCEVRPKIRIQNRIAVPDIDFLPVGEACDYWHRLVTYNS